MNREVFVETPEGVRFGLPLAGPGARFAAWLIDLLVVIAATSFAGRALNALRWMGADATAAVTALAYFAISVGYGIAAEWRWRGQTVGKRVMQLRVVDARGLPLQFGQILIRNLLRFVDSLPALYLVGGAAVLLTRDAQRLGDLAANTVVIRRRLALEPPVAGSGAGRYNSLLENRTLAARLRQHAGPALVAVAYEAVRRRDEMEPAARVEVFRRVAQEFQKVVVYPSETAESMTDEQFVRAALDVVFFAGRFPG